MSILKKIFCKEQIRVLPSEIKENDYMTAVTNNTKNKFGDKIQQYGYLYKNSIAIYKVSRFAEQDQQTQMAALLFDVQFFAYTIYPPYNVPVDCQITNKQYSPNYKTTFFLMQPLVILDQITRKFYDINPIYIQSQVDTKSFEDQEKYKIGQKVTVRIYMGTPYIAEKDQQISYVCQGTIQGMQTDDVYQQKQFENYEQKYIEKKNKMLESPSTLGSKKKYKNNKKNTEEMLGGINTENQDNFSVQTSNLHLEQNLDMDLDDIDSESNSSENNQKKNKENDHDLEKTRKKKVQIYREEDEETQESEDEYDTEEEEDEEQEEQDDLTEYGPDEEDENDDNDEKENSESIEELE